MAKANKKKIKRARPSKPAVCEPVEELVMWELRVRDAAGNPTEPAEIHDFIMECFLDDDFDLALEDARTMLKQCACPGELIEVAEDDDDEESLADREDLASQFKKS